MLAKVDDRPVALDALWWPGMNFGQYRWEGSIGRYQLEVERAVFVERLAEMYGQCVRELRGDDSLVREQEPSPLRDRGYPPLDTVLEDAAARFELFSVYLYEKVFEAFVPYPPSGAAIFMINSIDAVELRADALVICGRGYHGRPGFGSETD
jgi:hypothetical protein